MNNCSCLESVKALVTTGKWEGGNCDCCKKITIGHVIIAGLLGLMFAGLLGAFITRRIKE